MSEMIERLVATIGGSLGCESADDLLNPLALERAARAAVAAMREPTKAMLSAAADLDPMYDDGPTFGDAYWRVMIDEALT
jgi:homoserine acetyltransferase